MLPDSPYTFHSVRMKMLAASFLLLFAITVGAQVGNDDAILATLPVPRWKPPSYRRRVPLLGSKDSIN
jgi:hypothetical protein